MNSQFTSPHWENMIDNDRENVFTVSEVNRHLRNVIETNIPNLLVEGEIANYTHHRSGHIYFSLKDEKSSLRCVFFKSFNRYLNFKPKVGDKVVCAGRLTVFEKAGNYQLNVNRMEAAGMGELQRKFEQLKAKLEEEGLFSQQYKKPIPKFPQVVGVVTSPTGAAIQDIRNVISRRYPCRVLLYPATVQGEKAAEQIIAGIEYFNEHTAADVLIVGRGGGSQEDLFCFNDEQLARAIFASQIPIISAVGHEIDFTISDFVADLRAPTPSAAAELAVPNRQDLLNQLDGFSHKMKMLTKQSISDRQNQLYYLERKLQKYHPQTMLQNLQQRLDSATMKLMHLMQTQINNYRHQVAILQEKLHELSPQEALKRGYAILRQEKKIIKTVEQLQKDRKLEIILSDGKAIAKILETDS
ncbi:MAG: exodeoxyribonuclease large subunit [Candidatus Cloacimonadota bacterium]|nr:exodeoxyribonuclease large subunit [Candidatus Cloacimonadota bacterium]